MSPKSVGVSRSHLYRVFMLNVGKSPIDYLTEYRVNELAALRSGTLSIAEGGIGGLPRPVLFFRGCSSVPRCAAQQVYDFAG